MATSWKSFDFFEATNVKLGDQETRQFFEGNEISCVCSGSDSLFAGSHDGFVRIMGPSWKVVKFFRAHETGTVTQMRQVEGTSLLVTVAEDLINDPVLKTWALDKLEKKTGLPRCLSTIAITSGSKQFPISAFAALDDLSQLAIGFANGAVTLIRGDLVNDLGTKQRTVHESEEPITGLQLQSQDKLTTLFVCTTARIVKLVISGKGQAQPPRNMEEYGCAVGCMTVDQTTGDMIVARDDAIYYYTMEGRGPPRAYEAQKSLVAKYQDYVVIVSPPEAGAGVKEAASMRRRFGGTAADALFNTSTFSILHTDLRLIAYSEALVSAVKAVVELWGDLFAILQGGKVRRYHQKRLQQRLELLYQRNLFPLAIELAQSSALDTKQQQVIFRKFGDSLYQKGDYDGAMSQYIRAIDTTEPSQVIRKFLDTQRIHNLIEYLEELHHQHHQKATSDHTTLLLNCYAKLKDIDKLERFIKSPGDLKFDLDTAVLMCRQGGYYEQGAYLAKKHGEEDLVIDILIEDCKKYDEALHYIWQLDPQAAYPCLIKYARILIENCPKDATQLFIDYYTGKYQPRPSLVASSAGALAVAVEQSAATPSSGRGIAASAAHTLTSLIPLPYMNTSTAGTPSSQANHPSNSGQVAAAAGKATITTAATVATIPTTPKPAPKYTPPQPRTAFSYFIDHPDEFIVFLEALLAASVSSAVRMTETDRTDLNTTLFEMYLLKASEKKGDSVRETWQAKAKSLIASPAVENSDVLVLSHLSSFQAGTQMVKEQAGLLADIFRSYTTAKDTAGAMKALRKYGPREPSLYVLALSYLVSDACVLEEAGPGELSEILAKIDADNLMAPLQVVQTLSSPHSVATMGLIKPYLATAIERERKEIATNRQRSADFRGETALRREELRVLGEKPVVFQATRCADCGGALDLPVVHFLCKHSFHQKCLKGGGASEDGGGGGDGGTEWCPTCKGQNAAIRAMKTQQGESRERHDLFRAEVERSSDPFGTLAGWFGRGVMGS